jgi:cell division protein FtsW (lipid II flippase)
MKFLRFLHRNLKWVFCAVGYVLGCWAAYQDVLKGLPWHYILISFALGAALGIAMLKYLVIPFSRYCNNKIWSWLDSFGNSGPVR